MQLTAPPQQLIPPWDDPEIALKAPTCIKASFTLTA
jgi:hypothetical protein